MHPGVNLLPGANLHPGANCAHEHGFREVFGLLSTVFDSSDSTYEEQVLLCLCGSHMKKGRLHEAVFTNWYRLIQTGTVCEKFVAGQFMNKFIKKHYFK